MLLSVRSVLSSAMVQVAVYSVQRYSSHAPVARRHLTTPGSSFSLEWNVAHSSQRDAINEGSEVYISSYSYMNRAN